MRSQTARSMQTDNSSHTDGASTSNVNFCQGVLEHLPLFAPSAPVASSSSSRMPLFSAETFLSTVQVASRIPGGERRPPMEHDLKIFSTNAGINFSFALTFLGFSSFTLLTFHSFLPLSAKILIRVDPSRYSDGEHSLQVSCARCSWGVFTE